MNLIYSILGYPLGFVMWFCYKIIPNYGLALILFAFIAKAAMLPLGIKQQKSTVKMRIFQPKVAEIQKKYANNREKMAEELNALYAEEGYSPTAGCLPMIIQFIILFGLIDVIYKPLTHIVRLSSEVIAQATDIATQAGFLANLGNSFSSQIALVGAVQQHPDAFGALGSDVITQISSLDLNFLGLNLAEVPSFGFNILFLIPILSAVTSLLLSLVTMKTTAAITKGTPGAGATNVMMMVMMPLMMLWFTASVPAGVGIYWTISNVFSMVQTVFLNKFYNVNDLAEKEIAAQEERKAKEREAKLEARRRARELEGTEAAKALSQKEIDRQRLAEARRRMAEKYGEAYEEESDSKK